MEFYYDRSSKTSGLNDLACVVVKSNALSVADASHFYTQITALGLNLHNESQFTSIFIRTNFTKEFIRKHLG